MRILSCLVVTHNPWLILLALAVGITGSWVTFRLFRQARVRVGRQRAGWVLLASQAAGSSIWCVHFIAVVAYDAGAAFTFDPAWTMVSLFVAVTGCAYGFWVALSKGIYAAPEIGGVVVGLAISAMHYSGMLAFRIDGLIDGRPATSCCRSPSRCFLVCSPCARRFGPLSGMRVIWRSHCSCLPFSACISPAWQLSR